MIDCILVNPSGDVLHAVKASGGTVIDFKECDVMIKVPEEWVIWRDDLHLTASRCYEGFPDFISSFDVEESDPSKVIPRLLVPAPDKEGPLVLVWELCQDGAISATCLADTLE